MPKINHCSLEFKFEFEHIDHRIMTVTVENNGQVYKVEPVFDTNSYLGTAKLDIKLPTSITLTFSNKNQNTDTKIDIDGVVVQDVCVKIKCVRLDGFKIADDFLQQKLKLIATDSSIWIGPYIGFNGTMQIDLDKDNVFSQMIEFCRK